MTLFKHHATLFLIACLTLGLSGCSAFSIIQSAQQRGKEIIFGAHVNLTEKSYAAADYLTQQMHSFIDDTDVIKAEPLTNIDAPSLSSKLAHLIPAQVGGRFAQLGYHMNLSEVITKADHTFQNISAVSEQADHILQGTYRSTDDGFSINLRILNLETNHIIAVFDYHIPHNTDIKQLAEPEAQIIIVKP